MHGEEAGPRAPARLSLAVAVALRSPRGRTRSLGRVAAACSRGLRLRRDGGVVLRLDDTPTSSSGARETAGTRTKTTTTTKPSARDDVSDSDVSVASPSASGAPAGNNWAGGVAFGVLAAVIVGWGAMSQSRERAAHRARAVNVPHVLSASARSRLGALRESDPAFSLVLFDDFLVLLYTELKIAHGLGRLARYRPYLTVDAEAALTAPEGAVAAVVVGSATIDAVSGLEPPSTHVKVRVIFETNYEIRGLPGHGRSTCAGVGLRPPQGREVPAARRGSDPGLPELALRSTSSSRASAGTAGGTSSGTRSTGAWRTSRRSRSRSGARC